MTYIITSAFSACLIIHLKELCLKLCLTSLSCVLSLELGNFSHVGQTFPQRSKRSEVMQFNEQGASS